MHRETDNSFYAYTEEIRNESNRNLRDMQYAGDGGNVVGDGKQTGSEGLQTDTSGNDEHLRNGNKGEFEKSKINDDDIHYAKKSIDGYTKVYEMQIEINQLTEQIRALEKSDDFGAVMDELSRYLKTTKWFMIKRK